RNVLVKAKKLLLKFQKVLEQEKSCKEKGVCPMCRELANKVKELMIKKEEDGVILKQLTKICKTKVPNKQANCLEIAMKLSEEAMKVKDATFLNTENMCRKAGACRL
ncbi:chromosome partition protein, putative, partial [Entamoeba invadens IP1]|uniref:chromosome partition protein, putative n=1 Tax=Entamoeba invadens IP1 TaxID=370355 RepID=UPI0002C3D011